MLDTLPDEIILHICSFLEAKFVISVVGRLNSRLYSLLKDPWIYKLRLRDRWKNAYPSVVNDWKRACVYREEANRLWSRWEESLTCWDLRVAESVSVDAVIISSDLVLAGSRDRSITAWSIPQVRNGTTKPAHQLSGAHEGWIWSLTSGNPSSTTLYSGSWDTTVGLWDIAPHGLVRLNSLKLKTAVLSTAASSNIFCAGTFDQKVAWFDARCLKKVGTGNYHRMAVLALSVSPEYIISASEDRNVVFFDRRAKKRAETLNFDSYVTSLFLIGDTLYCGDKSGAIHLVDIKSFQVVRSFPGAHSNQVTGIHVGLGSVVSSSTDGTLKVFQPDLSMENINVVHGDQREPITGLFFDECKNVLASGQVGSVQLWFPKNSNNLVF